MPTCAKMTLYSRIENLNHSLFRRTYLYNTYMGDPPGPRDQRVRVFNTDPENMVFLIPWRFKKRELLSLIKHSELGNPFFPLPEIMLEVTFSPALRIIKITIRILWQS